MKVKEKFRFDVAKLLRLTEGMTNSYWSSNYEFVKQSLDKDESELTEQQLIWLLNLEVQMGLDEFKYG